MKKLPKFGNILINLAFAIDKIAFALDKAEFKR